MSDQRRYIFPARELWLLPIWVAVVAASFALQLFDILKRRFSWRPKKTRNS